MDNTSKRKLAENEVVFREANKSVAEFAGDGTSDDKPLRFYCECSKEECRERIELSPAKYRELHQNSRLFIALPGHEVTEIEKIVSPEGGFNLIEKFDEPPSPEELNLAVKNIEI
jgi:hypothetical protein